VTAVATRAGVAAGTVYTHFPSKAGLFTEVFRGANATELDLVSEIAHQGHDPVPSRLSHAVEAWARRALAAPTLAWALMAEPVDPALELERSESKRAYRDVFAELLDEGVRRHELPPLDPRLAAASIVGAMQEALIGPLAEPALSTEVLVASLIAFVLNAVQAKETAAWPSRHTRRTRPTRS
jgi:AcrR family transcriptional regulator